MNNGDIMILETIAQANRERYAEIEKQIPLEEIKRKALAMGITDEFPFEKALAKDGISYICEVKKASPSKGIIAENFPYVQIAKDYENAGASAISALTEPKWFKGENSYLQEISQNVKIPLLRKDFTVCEYQIYEAKVIGASAVLLICALLDTETIRKWIKICDSLGLSALVEAHTEEEVKSALDAGARVIGVNNRNLKDFTVDLTTCTRLRKLVPKEILFVGESGIKTAEDVQKLREAGVNGLLIGETLMRNPDKKQALAKLNGAEL
jgi:indole-3-glycerol phosphate synthase